MRSLWRERRMATACRDRTQCADGVKAVGVAGGVFTRTSQASAFSVSQPGGPGLASRAQDTLAFGGIGGANRRHGPGVRSLARPCLATPPTTANSFYCVLMLAYCLRRRSNPPSTRRRPRKTIVTRRLDFHLWKFALTCARFLGIRCHSEGYRLIGVPACCLEHEIPLSIADGKGDRHEGHTESDRSCRKNHRGFGQ